MKHYKFSITFKSELLLGQSKTPTVSQRSRSLVFAVFAVHGSIVHEHGWSSQRVVIKVWHSLSVEDLVEIPPSGQVCPGSRQMAVCNYGKGTATPCVGMPSQDTGRLEMPKGTFWRPQGSPYRAYLARIPRTVLPGISKIRPMAAAFIPAPGIPTTRHHWASVALISLLCLSGAHTAIQTVEIYGQRFRNSWLDCHETWQKWSRGVNFEV